MSVESHEADPEDTFCAVVPDKHAFTLAGGVNDSKLRRLRTGMPGRGDLPEDALPDKWEPFVKINYAYGDGADVVNKLTDEYATEHNVQNPPLE